MARATDAIADGGGGAIERADAGDWSAIWPLLEPVFRAGETYAFPTDISEADARRAWFEAPTAVFVARDEAGAVLGTYYIKPNHPGPGRHVCNCGYVVAEAARGRGLASRMCEHSLGVARELGFVAMQYNLVVATNEAAIRVWRKHGFDIVGTLPRAFAHPRHGLVDAHVMYRLLEA